MVSSENDWTIASTGNLFGGGVLIIDKFLAFIRLNWSVLGIGVAVSVKVSTLTLYF